MELQARLIAASPRLMDIAAQLVASVDECASDAPPEMVRLAGLARTALKSITDILVAPSDPRARPGVEAA